MYRRVHVCVRILGVGSHILFRVLGKRIACYRTSPTLQSCRQ